MLRHFATFVFSDTSIKKQLLNGGTKGKLDWVKACTRHVGKYHGNQTLYYCGHSAGLRRATAHSVNSILSLCGSAGGKSNSEHLLSS